MCASTRTEQAHKAKPRRRSLHEIEQLGDFRFDEPGDGSLENVLPTIWVKVTNLNPNIEKKLFTVWFKLVGFENA